MNECARRKICWNSVEIRGAQLQSTFDCRHTLIQGVFMKKAPAQADDADLLTGAAEGRGSNVPAVMASVRTRPHHPTCR